MGDDELGPAEAGETDERLHHVAVWRETLFFTDGERAAIREQAGRTW